MHHTFPEQHLQQILQGKQTPSYDHTCVTCPTSCYIILRVRPVPPSPPQEIPLSEILEVRPAGNFALVPAGTNPHCFELITGTMCYFVGEDPNSLPSSLAPSNSQTLPQTPPSPSQVAPNSGVGREVAKAWESAIRQALMPVSFQDAPPAAGKTSHSE